MSFTKGNWFFDKEEREYMPKGNEDLFVGTIRSDDIGLTLATIVGDFNEDEAIANAHLIAASKDLYEALKEAQSYIARAEMSKGNIERLGIEERMIKALAKAEAK